MSENDRTVARMDFVLDVEGRDVAAIIDVLESSGYTVDYLPNPDEDEPHAYIMEEAGDA